ncbi:MAG: hypothetical protein AAGA33_11410 [Pseudomonadota bacterium]
MDTIVMVALSSVASAGAVFLFMQLKSGAEGIGDYLPMKGRQRQLTGKWLGDSVKSLSGGESLHYTVSLDIEAAMRQTTGYGKLEAEQDGRRESIEIEILTGGFLHGEYLKMDYRSDDSHKAHFGSIIGSLGDDGQTIEATMSGFSELLGAPGTGQLTLKKER